MLFITFFLNSFVRHSKFLYCDGATTSNYCLQKKKKGDARNDYITDKHKAPVQSATIRSKFWHMYLHHTSDSIQHCHRYLYFTVVVSKDCCKLHKFMQMTHITYLARVDKICSLITL